MSDKDPALAYGMLDKDPDLEPTEGQIKTPFITNYFRGSTTFP